MNELVTPPGYVEYPRDPKFRKLDKYDRLAQAVKASSSSTVSICCSASMYFNFLRPRSFSWTFILLDALVVIALLLMVNSCLRRTYVAMDWNPRIATLCALALSALLLVHLLGIYPFALTLVISYGSLTAVICHANYSLNRVLRNLGCRMPKDVNKKGVPDLAEELRTASQAAAAIEISPTRETMWAIRRRKR